MRVISLDPQVSSSVLIAGWLVLNVGGPLAMSSEPIDGSRVFDLLWRALIVPFVYLVIRQLVPAVKSYRSATAASEAGR